MQNEYENGRGYAHDAYAHVPEHTHISSIFGYLWAWQVVLGLPHVDGHCGYHWKFCHWNGLLKQNILREIELTIFFSNLHTVNEIFFCTLFGGCFIFRISLDQSVCSISTNH